MPCPGNRVAAPPDRTSGTPKAGSIAQVRQSRSRSGHGRPGAAQSRAEWRGRPPHPAGVRNSWSDGYRVSGAPGAKHFPAQPLPTPSGTAVACRFARSSLPRRPQYLLHGASCRQGQPSQAAHSIRSRISARRRLLALPAPTCRCRRARPPP